MTPARTRTSAGLLLYRRRDTAADDGLEVLIGHLGGPLWARKDARAWSIPKGEHGPDEAPLDAARREFAEELGQPPPPGPYVALGTVKQSGGKTVTAWAVEADLDPADVTPGTFTMEWPPRSGRLHDFPELDRVAWVPPERARELLVAAQAALVDRLLAAVGEPERT